MPKALDPLLHSGILLASASALLLNLYCNGRQGEAKARSAAAATSQAAEAH